MRPASRLRTLARASGVGPAWARIWPTASRPSRTRVTRFCSAARRLAAATAVVMSRLTETLPTMRPATTSGFTVDSIQRSLPSRTVTVPWPRQSSPAAMVSSSSRSPLPSAILNGNRSPNDRPMAAEAGYPKSRSADGAQ